MVVGLKLHLAIRRHRRCDQDLARRLLLEQIVGKKKVRRAQTLELVQKGVSLVVAQMRILVEHWAVLAPACARVRTCTCPSSCRSPSGSSSDMTADQRPWKDHWGLPGYPCSRRVLIGQASDEVI